MLFQKVRTYGLGIVGGLMCLENLMCTKMYPMLLDSIDLHGCLMVYGAGCIIGFLFVLFVTKETKGQPLDEVDMNENK